MARKHYQISHEDELRWVGVLFQLVTTRIALHQTPVSPPPAESQGTSARPRQEVRRAIFLTEHHDSQETSQAESCCAQGCRAERAPEFVHA